MTEAKYIAASQATHEAMWLQNFIAEVFQPLTGSYFAIISAL